MVVRQDQIRVLPTTLPLSRAVLAEPLAVGLHALNRAGGVARAKVLVSGSGPIGILAAGAAKMAGAEEVWTTDVLEQPLKIASDVGVDRTVRVGVDDLPDRYFDVAIEASGASVAIGPTLAAVRPRGIMMQLGMFPPGPRPAELSALVAKEIDLRGAFRFDTEFDESIALLAGSAALDPVITHSFSACATLSRQWTSQPTGILGQGCPSPFRRLNPATRCAGTSYEETTNVRQRK